MPVAASQILIPRTQMARVRRGAADGRTPTLRDQASLAIAFGAATWPHQLVRIMLLEQLYRAVTILAGHPYHRG